MNTQYKPREAGAFRQLPDGTFETLSDERTITVNCNNCHKYDVAWLIIDGDEFSIEGECVHCGSLLENGTCEINVKELGELK